MIGSVLAGLRALGRPELRSILWRSIGLSVLLLAVLWAALTAGAGHLLAWETVTDRFAWIDTLGVVVAGAGFLVVAIYLIPAVSALVASIFADEAAGAVERTDFPADPPGAEVALLPSILYGLRFAGLTLAVNLVALALLLVPVVNLVAFFGANAYLLSREYFELAAGRHRSRDEARALRRRHRLRVLAAGAVLAALLLVPVVNLVTPLFGVAMMTHLYKRIDRLEGGADAGPRGVSRAP